MLTALVTGSSHLILVVDDDNEIRRLIATTLRRQSLGDVIEARDGREALELMKSKNPDLVLLDLMMPGVSGWDVLEERRENDGLREIPVILISAHRGSEIAEAIGSDVEALLPKPFELEVLHAVVKSTLKAGTEDSNGGSPHESDQSTR